MMRTWHILLYSSLFFFILLYSSLFFFILLYFSSSPKHQILRVLSLSSGALVTEGRLLASAPTATLRDLSDHLSGPRRREAEAVPKEELMDTKRITPSTAVLLPGQRRSINTASPLPSSCVDILVMCRLAASHGPRVLA
jgi:hypothetical protein